MHKIYQTIKIKIAILIKYHYINFKSIVGLNTNQLIILVRWKSKNKLIVDIKVLFYKNPLSNSQHK